MRLTLLAIALTLLASAEPRAQQAPTVTIRGHVEAIEDGKPARQLPEGGLWVYLVDKDRSHKRSRPPTSQEIDQKNTAFTPHVLVVAKGTEVTFPNKDNEEHNVFSPEYFDLDRYGGGKSKSKKFDVDGEFEIYCDIHKCMWARVKVVDVIDETMIQAVPANGDYEFHVPPGTYEVYAWAIASPESPSGRKTVAVGETWEVAKLNVQLGRVDLRHNNKKGQPYPPGYTGRCP